MTLSKKVMDWLNVQDSSGVSKIKKIKLIIFSLLITSGFGFALFFLILSFILKNKQYLLFFMIYFFISLYSLIYLMRETDEKRSERSKTGAVNS